MANSDDCMMALVAMDQLHKVGFVRMDGGEEYGWMMFSREDDYATLQVACSARSYGVVVTLAPVVGGEPRGWSFATVDAFMKGLPAIESWIAENCGDEGDDHLNARVW